MLINTLFLFLREVLPLFLLCALLLVIINGRRQCKQVMSFGLGFGVVGYLLLRFVLDDLSQSMDGAGLELFYFAAACLQLVLYGVILFRLADNLQQLSVALWSLILGLFTAVSLVNFMTYFVSLWAQKDLNQPLALGSIIGAGIAASISVLLYFALYGLRACFTIIAPIALAFFLSGHFAAAVNLLEQVGIVESDVLWSTQHWLSDQNAFAVILSGLVGYESTPSGWQVFAYLLSLIGLLSIIVFRRQTLTIALKQSEELL